MKNKDCNIERILHGENVTDGDGVKIHRVIGTGELNHIDPFMLLDEIRSENKDDFISGFPTHPHRGIETITYMIKGSFRHKDSKGGEGVLTDGCVQWMSAGAGVLHSEMPENPGDGMWGYQLWLSLPKKDKFMEPRYQSITPEMIPLHKKEGISVKIISGEFEGKKGPAKNIVAADYFDVRLEEDGVFNFTTNEDMTSFIYVHSGVVSVCPAGNNDSVKKGDLCVLSKGANVTVRGVESASGFLFLSSIPNNEPIVRGGPFVMNSKEELQEAFEDYKHGRIG